MDLITKVMRIVSCESFSTVQVKLAGSVDSYKRLKPRRFSHY